MRGRKPRLRHRASLLIVLAAALMPLLAAEARPDPTPAELDEARVRFAQARKLEDAKDWAGALDLLQRVGQVKMTPQVRFHIALCMENVGLLTEALEGFTLAQQDATGNAPDVVKESKQHIASLEKKIPTLTVRVTGADAADQLYLDRRPIPMGDPPLPIRVDPGAHTAEVHRGEIVVAKQSFAVEPETSQRIELRIDPNAAPPATATSAPDAGPPPVASAEPDAGAPTGPSAAAMQRTAGWAALGLGAASTIATGIFIGLRAGTISDAEAECPTYPKHCSTDDKSKLDPLENRGKTYAALVNVFGTVAGVAGIGGVVLLLTAPSTTAPAQTGRTARSIRAGGFVMPRGANLSVEGQF